MHSQIFNLWLGGGDVVGKASLRRNCEQLRSVNASSGKTKAQLLPPHTHTPHYPRHQWYTVGDEDSGLREGSCIVRCPWQMELQRGYSLLSVTRAWTVDSWPRWLVHHAGWLNFRMQRENCAPICYTHWLNNNNKSNQKESEKQAALV